MQDRITIGEVGSFRAAQRVQKAAKKAGIRVAKLGQIKKGQPGFLHQEFVLSVAPNTPASDVARAQGVVIGVQIGWAQERQFIKLSQKRQEAEAGK